MSIYIFSWNPPTFTILGVDFSVSLGYSTDMNIKKKHLENMKQKIRNWKKRQLTPYGKGTEIKSLLLSQVVHILTALRDPTNKLIKKIETLFYGFL